MKIEIDTIERIKELEEALTSRFNNLEAEQERFNKFNKLLEEKIDKILNVSKLITKIACMLPLERQYMYYITDSGIKGRELRSISVEDNELVYHFDSGVSTKHAFETRVDAENYIKNLYGIEH